MLNLIIGGAGSGKSAFAEKLVCTLPGRRVYLATMTATDQESLERIQKHRVQRSGLDLETLEHGMDLAGASLPQGANVLLEDLSNLLANEMFNKAGGGVDAVRDGLKALHSQCRNLTVVSNDIFSDGVQYGEEVQEYIRNLAELNRMLAADADLVVEIVSGLPNVLKGELP